MVPELNNSEQDTTEGSANDLVMTRLADAERRARFYEEAYVETRVMLSEFRALYFARQDVRDIGQATRSMAFFRGFIRFFPLRLALYRYLLKRRTAHEDE